jgi:hypothetical protein
MEETRPSIFDDFGPESFDDEFLERAAAVRAAQAREVRPAAA